MLWRLGKIDAVLVESKDKHDKPKSNIAILTELDPHLLRADKSALAYEENILKCLCGIQERTFWGERHLTVKRQN